MKLFSTIVVVYLAFAAVIVAIAYSMTGGQAEPFSKVAGVGLTLLTALLAAVGAFLGVSKQAATAREVELLKKTFTQQIEGLKLRLSERAKAFNELSRCAYGYYDALAELERGVINQARVDAADIEMQKVRYLKNHLHAQCREAWERYWQEAYNTSVQARGMPADQCASLWQNRAKVLAEWLSRFTELCKEKHQLGAVEED